MNKLRDRLLKLHALLGSDNAGERDTARIKIDELLAKHKKTWNDLLELLAGDDQGDDLDEPPTAPATTPAPLDLIHHILERHLHLTEHQLVAVTLWIAHSFVFRRFAITPRLVAVSPVKGCGKTTLLNIIKALGFKTRKVDHITAAVLFRLIDRDRAALLLDEVDNADLLNNPAMRSVINSGHHCDGTVMRYLEGESREFSTFAPLALAAIGKLPMPVMHRSVVINMERSPVRLPRFDPKTIRDQQIDCETVYRQTFDWAVSCPVNLDPPLPEELRNRAADNWRVLIAIADACPGWGELAREAAIALSGNQDEDLAVTLLEDVRTIFDRQPAIDRLTSALIVAELNEMTDAAWSEWRGPRGDQSPRRLSQGQLALMLAPFGVRPRTIWPVRRAAGDKSAKGYFRRDFESPWASYCAGTPARGGNIRLVGQ